MGEYSSCAHCGNTEDGTTLYQCSGCGEVYCDSCKASGSFLFCCPSCGENIPIISTLGSISSGDDD